MIKKCFKCNEIKSINEFYIHKQMTDGYLNKCKECTKIDSKRNIKNKGIRVINSYDRTEKGVIRVIYKSQKQRSKVRGHKPPNYTKNELKKWLYVNNFKKLYDNWVDSGYLKNMKPSVDRSNDYVGYSFDNIKLTTWKNNREKARQDMLLGRGTNGEMCKPVLCFDKNMNLIEKYVSCNSAIRTVGYSPRKALKTHKPDRANGFIWWYEEDYKK